MLQWDTNTVYPYCRSAYTGSPCVSRPPLHSYV